MYYTYMCIYIYIYTKQVVPLATQVTGDVPGSLSSERRIYIYIYIYTCTYIIQYIYIYI